MNKEKQIICTHELNKLMSKFERMSGIGQPINALVAQNSEAIYTLAEIIREILEDKD